MDLLRATVGRGVKLGAIAFVLGFSASAVLAEGPKFGGGDTGGPHAEAFKAPEIDAAHGLASLAVVAGALMLAWERSRRRD